MLSPSVDTIAAVATAQGRGGVGVIRISGSDIEGLTIAILGTCPAPRHAKHCNFLDSNGDTLDQGVALYFPAPYSYTGENVLELQGHGGPAVLQVLLQRCLGLGARLAQPGEFTRRAFLNGKLDLAQAESVADLIEANSTEAARSAVRSLSGEFSHTINILVNELVYLRTLVEAMLDFPEEEIEADDIGRRDVLLNNLKASLKRTLDAAKQGSLLREGAHVAIVGQPNVGKSSLLNKLAGEDLALVSSIPGTTRDVIRQAIQIRGVTLHIMDTAGLRASEDEVERMGIALTHQTLRRADMVLLLFDGSQPIDEFDQAIFKDLPKEMPRLMILNKIDLISNGSFKFPIEGDLVKVSAKTGEGLEMLRDKLLEVIGWREQESGIFMARERHLQALTTAQHHLLNASANLNQAELFAEELRLAQRALNEITGEFTSDDLLGEIFGNFCIGK